MRILLADDETSVIQALSSMLKSLPNHDVRVATTGEKALENASAMGGVDLLITDVVMEPMDGFTLRDEMVSRYPNARTIFISGYDLSDYPAQTNGHQVLQKPIAQAALLAAVHRELAAILPTASPAAAAAVSASVPDVIFQRAQPAGVAAAAAVPIAAPVPIPVSPVAAATVAVPKAVPVAVSGAKPAPVAQPTVKAVPVAQPTVKAVPATAQATPTAKPVAIRAAVPGAGPTAIPTGQPVVKAVSAQPQAREASAPPQAIKVAAPAAGLPVATAKGAVRAVAPLAVTPPASPLPPPPPPPPPSADAGESLIGQTLGAYQIVSYLGEGRLGSAYAAVQISINRPVGLKVLDPARAQDETVKARFIADARAKAHVQHPAILAVYEAGEAAGRYFFAREYVDGQNLAEAAALGRTLPEPAMLKVLRTVAEGFLYFQTQNIPHRPLEATKVFIGIDGATRIANLAVQVADEHRAIPQELQALGYVASSVAEMQNYSPGLRALIGRLQQAPASGLNAWGQVLQAIKALEPRVIPNEAAKISARDEAAIKAVEAVRKAQRRSFWLNVGSLIFLFAVVIFLALRKFVFTNERKIQRMVRVPAGTYKLPGGKSTTVDQDFWIDKYEVTLAQYGRFLEYLEQHPTEEPDFRHPKMPRHLEHRPEYWEIYYKQALINGAAHSVKIDLNCPALTVTWWDAYAYAKWLGRQTGTERDLPTEEEWEVAASGGKGLKFPWGDEFDDSRANTNVDYYGGDPRAKADKDGFVYWGQVDAKRGDKSPLGVYGMAGNVAEWTGSWTKDNKFPIIKGGDFFHPPASIDKRISDHPADKGEEWLGFRTISRTQPLDVE